VVVVPLDRGDQCGHFGTLLSAVGALLRETDVKSKL
jgi:hypothetical protein